MIKISDFQHTFRQNYQGLLYRFIIDEKFRLREFFLFSVFRIMGKLYD